MAHVLFAKEHIDVMKDVAMYCIGKSTAIILIMIIIKLKLIKFPERRASR